MNAVLFSEREVQAFVRENDVKFIRLAFCDLFGTQKNISILPAALGDALEEGVRVDAASIPGFGGLGIPDLFLVPDAATAALLPWRPSHGRVARFYCALRTAQGTPFAGDVRALLQETLREADAAGFTFDVGAECGFCLFKTDENGRGTAEPFDEAGYMDIAPRDKGENIRREICLTLEEMGITPESSHHERGPGQNEICFARSGPLASADNVTTFKSVVRTIAARGGAEARFEPKPLPGPYCNDFHINFSFSAPRGRTEYGAFLAGLLEHLGALTLFLNPTEESYARLEAGGSARAAWSRTDRAALVRVPQTRDGQPARIEARSPDCCSNPYLAYTLLLRAGLDGLRRGLTPPEPDTAGLVLPASLAEARERAEESAFVAAALPQPVLRAYMEA